jgi:hypothetical protein
MRTRLLWSLKISHWYWLAALIPPAVLVAALVRWFVNVPYLDQWWLLPLIAAQREGRLTFDLIWHQNAEHRLFFPKLIMLELARWSAWDLRWEVAVNLALTLVCFGAIVVHLHAANRLVRSTFTSAYIVLAAFVLFSPAPFENWLWSWQLPYFLIQFCVIACGWCLAFHRRSFFAFVVALSCAVVASWSFATGFGAWVSGMVPLLLVARRSVRIRALLCWVLGAVLTLAIYLWDYKFLSWSDPIGAVQRLWHFIGYVLVFLGSALVPTHWLNAAMIFGVVYVGVYTYLLVNIARSHPRLRLATASFLSWSAFALSASMLTAVGRSNVHNLTQAMAPRYITFTQLGWLGILFALTVVLRARNCLNHDVIRKLMGGIRLLILVGFAVAYLNGIRGMSWLSNEMATGLHALVTSPEDRTALRKLYVLPDQLREEFLPLLKAYHLGPFRK